MSEQLATNVMIPVAATPAALGYQVSAAFSGSTEMIAAINDGATAFLTKLPTTQEWSIDCEVHVDDTTNTTLDVVVAAWIAKTALTGVEFDMIASGYNFSGNAYVSDLSMSKATQDFPTMSFTLTGNGAVAAA